MHRRESGLGSRMRVATAINLTIESSSNLDAGT